MLCSNGMSGESLRLMMLRAATNGDGRLEVFGFADLLQWMELNRRSGRLAVAQGRDRRVLEAWTGVQVEWPMARGYPGAFGGTEINRVALWLAFCALFFFGLADLRRPLSLRNLDLIALLSFSVSLWYFNKGDIFWSTPLIYPPMIYLIARLSWIGLRRVRIRLP